MGAGNGFLQPVMSERISGAMQNTVSASGVKVVHSFTQKFLKPETNILLP